MTWRYFTRAEFRCKETLENKIDDAFLDRLDELRHRCGFAFTITSGYRSPIHSKEVNKPNGPGTHSQGIAADVAVADGVQRRRIVEQAIDMKFNGIGVAKSFVHVDDRDGQTVMWTY